MYQNSGIIPSPIFCLSAVWAVCVDVMTNGSNDNTVKCINYINKHYLFLPLFFLGDFLGDCLVVF